MMESSEQHEAPIPLLANKKTPTAGAPVEPASYLELKPEPSACNGDILMIDENYSDTSRAKQAPSESTLAIGERALTTISTSGARSPTSSACSSSTSPRDCTSSIPATDGNRTEDLKSPLAISKGARSDRRASAQSRRGDCAGKSHNQLACSTNQLPDSLSLVSNNDYTDKNTNDSSASLSDDQSGSSVNRYRPQKYCAVCGDKAIACNFNAVTCESCKAFFRRNAFKEQRLKCLFNNRCVIDKVTRRFCSKCRLYKCFEIGMKREWILTDEQKHVKRVKILQNKQIKQQQVSTSSFEGGDGGGGSSSSSESRPRPRSTSNSTASATMNHLGQSNAEADAKMMVSAEAGASRKRPRSSLDCATADDHDGRSRLVEKRDASTSCPDEADLSTGQIGPAHCAHANQCQYCSLRLQPLVSQSIHESFEHQYNQTGADHYHHQSRQHFDYYQSQQHIRHDSNECASAYSQHRIAAAAATAHSPTSIRTNGGGGNSNSNSSSGTGSSSSSSSRSISIAYGSSPHSVTEGFLVNGHPVAASTTCATPQSTCCCLTFSEIFQSQRYNRPPLPGEMAPVQLTSHKVYHHQNSDDLSCNQTPHLHTLESVHMQVLRPNQLAQAERSSSREGPQAQANTGAGRQSGTTSAMRNSDSAASQNPFLKALDAHKTYLERSPPEANPSEVKISEELQTQASDVEVSNQALAVARHQAIPFTDESNISSVKANELKGDHSHREQTGPAEQSGFKVVAAIKPDSIQYVTWNGLVYAHPAIADSEIRARVESIGFTETERHLVYEMIEALKFLFEANGPERTFKGDSLDDFVYFCDAALRRLIKTVKQIKAFRILSMDDQIMLLKSACFKILLLRSSIHYHDDIDGWLDRYGRKMPLDILKNAKCSVYERHKAIVTKLPRPLRKDRMVMGTLALILLFDPQDNLRHTNSVGLDNLTYLCILRKYLINTQPDPLEKYECLVEATQVINACNEEYNVFFSRNFQPEQISPLLIEIFDISINNSV